MVFRSTRILRKHWKLTAIAVFSLSIAMALGVVSLSVSDTFLLLPPAASEPDRLVKIYSRTPTDPVGSVSYPDYKYYRENNRVFTDIAAAPNSIQVSSNFDGNREVKVVGRPVSDNYFAVMGLRPYLGRLFAPGDDSVAKPIAVMTYSCWKRLGADPNIAGKEIAGYTIVGVTPREFTGSFYGFDGDLLTSLPRTDPAFTKRDSRPLVLVARLKPGVSRRQAQADLSILSAQLACFGISKEDKDMVAVVARATLLPASDPDVELGFAILMGFVLLVLLVACANVANLLLAVAVGKRQEAAIKLAVGSSRGRLIREFLSESALICCASAAIGYAAAAALIAWFSNFSFDLPMLGTYSLDLSLRLDATVVGATMALMLLTILVTGLPPALYASRPHLSQVLGGEIVVGGTRKNVRRSALVIVQVAVCTLVLVGMGLCQRSLYNLRNTNPGFSQRNLVAVTIYPQDKATEARGVEQQGDVRRAVASLAGVESVTLASSLPLSLGYNEVPEMLPDSDKRIPVGQVTVDGAYFSTFGIQVLSGRVFDSGDRKGSPDVVVVNQDLAEKFWPGQSPLGKTLLAGGPPRKQTVIGVVADGKYESFDEPPRAVLYSALSQHYQPSVAVVARTKGDPGLWIDPLNKAVQGLGIVLPFRPVTFDTWTNFTLLEERMIAASVAGLSVLGVLLAVVGLFGAISYSVSERRKELGIRIALGARPAQLLEMVLRQTLLVTGAGTAIGILLGVGATVLLRSQFFGVSAVEWTVLVPVIAVMLGISTLVAYLCARSWITIDPMEAVRHA